MLNILKKHSLLTILFIGTILSIYRISNVNEKEISWDVLGYYIPLPATFIHSDPLLNNTDWLKKVNAEKDLTGTLYMVSSNEEGEPMYFFLLGMAILFLPFFLIAHGWSMMFGLPMDGFSPPYLYAMVLGGIIYTLIGLYFYRKILNHFFSEKITSIILLTTVFATNYIHHLTLKNLETVNLLFMFTAIILWYTIKWHQNQRLKYMIIIGLSITLTSMIKPSEIMVVLIPLLWGIHSKETLKTKIALLKASKSQFIIAILLCFAIASPQIIYWLIKTGKPFYDSYKNPGVGLDIFSPHIIDSLISYKKGWLIYTPVMLLYLTGFIFLHKKQKDIFWAITIYFLISFYIITSWTEWWYGAGFSNRPLIVSYVVLGICFGFFLQHLSTKSRPIIATVTIFILACTFLNQFQWWQLKNYILEPYRTTKEYYWASFLKTSVTPADKELLLISRDFSGAMNFTEKHKYSKSILVTEKFNGETNFPTTMDSSKNYRLKIVPESEFEFTNKIPYAKVTSKDHAWLNFQFDVEGIAENKTAYLVVTMNRKEGDYGYKSFEINAISNQMSPQYSFDFLTPEIRSVNDELKFFIWNPNGANFEIDNFIVRKFEHK